MTGGKLTWAFSDREAAARLEEARNFGGHSPLALARARLRQDRAARWSLRFLLVAAALCLLAPLWPLQSPMRIDLESSLEAPLGPWEALRCAERFEPEYWELNAVDEQLVALRVKLFAGIQAASWLGRDALGRDLLARLVWGSRTSLSVALFATLVSLGVGVTYGALAGLCGGRVDALMMRLVDVLYSLPFVFTVIFVISVLGPQGGGEAGLGRERVLYLVIGAVWWLTMARVVRGQVLAIRETGYARAARAMGASRLHVLRVHVLPNVLPLVVVYLTLSIPAILLLEAFLSFLGLGVEPPKVSWGRLAVDAVDALTPLKGYWWLVVFPALAMGAVLLALNTLGDGLRDALDPRRRWSARPIEAERAGAGR